MKNIWIVEFHDWDEQLYFETLGFTSKKDALNKASKMLTDWMNYRKKFSNESNPLRIRKEDGISVMVQQKMFVAWEGKPIWRTIRWANVSCVNMEYAMTENRKKYI